MQVGRVVKADARIVAKSHEKALTTVLKERSMVDILCTGTLLSELLLMLGFIQVTWNLKLLR